MHAAGSQAGTGTGSAIQPHTEWVADTSGPVRMIEHDVTSDLSRPDSAYGLDVTRLGGKLDTTARTEWIKPESAAVKLSDTVQARSPGSNQNHPLPSPRVQHTIPNSLLVHSQHGDRILLQPSEAGSSAVLGSRRPRVKKLWQQRFVKLLVIGDSGLGKTTLVRSLLAVPGEQVELHDGSETGFYDFQRDPDQFLSTLSWTDEEDCIKWVYQIQDTPGYGDDLNLMTNINRVKEYLDKQNRKWMNLENSPNREDLAQAVDPRVDLVIFCLPPHRLRNIDLLFMWEISQVVPILPVVMKADTMTIKESVSYRTGVHRRLEHPMLPGRRGPIKLFSFQADTLTAVGCPDNAMAQAMRPPYLVVCSNEYNADRLAQADPELWPERRYMWGTSEAFNPQHSDLLLLRRLLLQEGVEEISLSKKKRYEEWRRREMGNVRPFRFVGRLILTTAATLGILLGTVHATGKVNVPRLFTAASKAVQEAIVTEVEQKEEEVEKEKEAQDEQPLEPVIVQPTQPVSETPPPKKFRLWQ